MVGLIVLLFGIAATPVADSVGVFSGIFVWGAALVSPPQHYKSFTRNRSPLGVVEHWCLSVSVHHSGISDCRCREAAESLSGEFPHQNSVCTQVVDD